MLIRPLYLLLICLGIVLPTRSTAQKLDIIFINPGFESNNSTGDFWLNVSEFAKAAAYDLDMKLTVEYAQRNHIEVLNIAQKASLKQPDAIIIVNEKKAGVRLIKEIAKYDIPIFLLLNTLSNEELSKLTNKEKSLIIGSIEPNNFLAGYKLMHSLAALHGQKLEYKSAINAKKEWNSVALLGDYVTKAAVERKKGLDKAVEELGNIKLIDAMPANWSEKEAYKRISGLSRRTHIDIVWAANDPMAFGAFSALQQNSTTNAFSVGGINWDINRVNAPIDISYGGHVILGGFAVVLVHDILKKYSPIQSIELDVFSSNKESYAKDFQTLIKTRSFNSINYLDFSLSSGKKKPFTVKALVESSQKLR